jgi:hypothetical protein
MRKKNHEILAALQYKLLYNISGSEKWGKKIQATSSNGAHTVYKQRVQYSRFFNSFVVNIL